jgi:hypothetical protein
MKDYHLSIGWSDIGQNLTLFPDGVWLLGRDFDSTPASILGWNTGALAVEMVGNFDVGGDAMTQAQKDAIYEMTEFVVEQLGWTPHFHRDSPTAYKTCPGDNIDRDTFFNEAFSFTEYKQQREQQAAEEAQRQAEQAQLEAEEQARLEAEREEQARQQAIELAKQKLEELKAKMVEFKTKFTDMVLPDGTAHWANDYVNYLADKNVIKGIPNDDGTFRYEPDNAITRAEAATLICKAMESIEEQIQKITNALSNANINV